MSIIEVKELAKIYDKNVAIDNVSFSVEKGEIFGLLGPNGAGKTTLISILSTILAPNRGSIMIDTFNIKTHPLEIRKKIGVVFQESIIDEDLSAYDNLDIHARLYGIKSPERKKRINNLLDLVGLKDIAFNKILTYSGGMKRKIELIRGLINDPVILFLDEPTLGLDPQSRRNIWDYILQLKKERDLTIILTTHYMGEADAICDRVGILHRGKFIKISTPKILKKSLNGDIIEVKIDAASDKTLIALKKIRGVRHYEQRNGLVRIYASYGEKKVGNIIDFFKKNKIRMHSITLKEPTLEDVFLHYTGDGLK